MLMWGALVLPVVPQWVEVKIGLAMFLWLAALLPLAAIVGVFVTAVPRGKVVAGLFGGLLAVPLMAGALVIGAFSLFLFALVAPEDSEVYSDGIVTLYSSDDSNSSRKLAVQVGPSPLLRYTDIQLHGMDRFERHGSWIRVETFTDCHLVHRITGESRSCGSVL